MNKIADILSSLYNSPDKQSSLSILKSEEELLRTMINSGFKKKDIWEELHNQNAYRFTLRQFMRDLDKMGLSKKRLSKQGKNDLINDRKIDIKSSQNIGSYNELITSNIIHESDIYKETDINIFKEYNNEDFTHIKKDTLAWQNLNDRKFDNRKIDYFIKEIIYEMKYNPWLNNVSLLFKRPNEDLALYYKRMESWFIQDKDIRKDLYFFLSNFEMSFGFTGLFDCDIVLKELTNG